MMVNNEIKNLIDWKKKYKKKFYKKKLIIIKK